MLVSIVIRTLNEARHLDELLSGIKSQFCANLDFEIVLVDSGSTDGTLTIAERHGCKIVRIDRQDFSFGRSLNMGCQVARGDIFAIISGHCVPTDDRWLESLCRPLVDGVATYAYGRQIGGPNSRYSERRIFAKYYPKVSRVPQEGFYCNNANSAICRSAWERQQFNEQLTGLEDMELAKRLVESGENIAYVADALVYHYHDESWWSVKRRFEREAIALRKIMPQIHVHKRDLVRYIASSVCLDLKSAKKDGVLLKTVGEIFQYRFFQYWGSYTGNHEHRVLSHAQKEEYYYPGETNLTYEEQSSSVVTDESQQRAG